MKKLAFLSLLFVIISCSLDGEENTQVVKLLTIDSYTTPQSFTFKTTDTISVKYILPDACHHFHSVYYQYENNARIIAIRAIENLKSDCPDTATLESVKIPIQVLQKEDYVFKFWKGKDSDGKDVFEEKVIPVN